jgi:hypothetical protein
MTKTPSSAGSRRPPEHTRFQKSQSVKFRGAFAEKPAEGFDGESDEEDDEDEDRFVFDGGEHARQFFGDRYEEFKKRFERAVNANNIDALCDLADDFHPTKFPGAGKKAGKI